MAKKKAAVDTASLRAFLEKIVVNVGVGRASQQQNFEDKYLPQLMKDIAAITGQQPHTTKITKSIAGFKVREGQVVGVSVTLRGQKMVDFFERFVRIVLPRVRDFAGMSSSKIDKGGTLNVGLKDQYVFSEISAEQSMSSFSLGISMVPKVKNRAQALEAFTTFGFPFAKE